MSVYFNHLTPKLQYFFSNSLEQSLFLFLYALMHLSFHDFEILNRQSNNTIFIIQTVYTHHNTMDLYLLFVYPEQLTIIMTYFHRFNCKVKAAIAVLPLPSQLFSQPHILSPVHFIITFNPSLSDICKCATNKLSALFWLLCRAEFYLIFQLMQFDLRFYFVARS